MVKISAVYLETAMNEAYTYEDRDNSIPTLPFIDDIEGFWMPFAVKVAAILSQEPEPTGHFPWGPEGYCVCGFYPFSKEHV